MERDATMFQQLPLLLDGTVSHWTAVEGDERTRYSYTFGRFFRNSEFDIFLSSTWRARKIRNEQGYT